MKRLIIQKIVQNNVDFNVKMSSIRWWRMTYDERGSSSAMFSSIFVFSSFATKQFVASATVFTILCIFTKFKQACCEFKVCECYSPFTDCSSPLKECCSSSSKLAHVELSCIFNPARNCLDSICQLLSRFTFQLQMLLMRNLLLLIKFSSCILILELSLSKLSLCNF